MYFHKMYLIPTTAFEKKHLKEERLKIIMLEINKIRVYKVTKYKVTFLTVSQVQRFSMFPTSPEYMVLLFL